MTARNTMHRTYKIRRQAAATDHGYSYQVGLPLELGMMLVSRGFTGVTFVMTDDGILMVPRKPEVDTMGPSTSEQIEALLDRLTHTNETNGEDD